MSENENGREIPLSSGASLYVSIADWQEAKALQDALARALVSGGLTAVEVAAVFKAAQFRAVSAPGQKDQGMGTAEKLDVVAALTRKALELVSNKELERAIFACAEKAIYRADGTPKSSVQFKLNAAGYGVFDNPICRDKARGDYYEICSTVVEENLRPFAKALSSMFAAHVEKIAASPASNTDQASARA